ncbi:MAG: hypothetical protein AMJ46_00330 [Latescibacteria bacterium DG_63]|nr:MAG: hypothetical protein AMJ46_00330 [Latescibacteria bacterium DG_63]
MDPGALIDGDLELVLRRTVPADRATGRVPEYQFEMRGLGRVTPVGSIRLRIGPAVKLRYPGHIGFEVREEYRGRGYAARSCRLIFPLAYAHGLSAVWLTVDPKNVSSQKTCEIIGAKRVDTVHISRDHKMYRHGARFRRRYRVDLRKALSSRGAQATR